MTVLKPKPIATICFSVAALVTLALPALTHASRSFDDCTPSQVRLSITKISNAFTGGRYPVFVNLRNISRQECSVEGHPLVVVSPHRFPVVVGDLADFDRNSPNIGPERVLKVRPGHSVHAYVGKKTVSLDIQACRREGVEVDTGPFLAAT